MFSLLVFSRRSNLIWLLLSGVFTLDLLFPSHWDLAFGYLLALFLSVSFKEKSDVLLLAVIVTVLSIMAAVVRPQEAPLQDMLFERLPAIAGCWTSAFFVIRFIGMREVEHEQEARFKALFEYASGGILLVNRSGKIVMVNPAAEKLFGYDSGELQGKAIEMLIPARFTKQHHEHREHYHQNPNPRSMGIGLDLHGRKKDDTEFPVEVSLSPFRMKDGEFTVAFVIDNTYRKTFENSILQQKQELASLTEALQHLNEELEDKVAERTLELEQAKNDLATALDKERELGELKSRFVSMASHEFRTPLTSILSSAGLVGQYATRQDFENVKKHADRIKNAVNGLNTILTEFLSLGRLEEGRIHTNIETVDVARCVEEVHQELKSLFKAGQTFVHRHEGSETAQPDNALTKNSLINLVSNAIKYSPENATITVESSAGEKTTRISVLDEGIGIPESEQKHLFDRFFRASNATNIQGTGLGLYIVQRYAEVTGGHIGFKSRLDKGSEFWAEWPA